MIVGLIERWICLALLVTAAKVSARADSYAWVFMWRKLVVLAVLNVAMCLVAWLLTVSAQNLRRPAASGWRWRPRGSAIAPL